MATDAAMPPHTNDVFAAVYCRISLARFGDTLKVDDQEVVARQLAGGRGWRVRDEHVYKDNSRSAWQKNRVRPGWDAMLAAYDQGDFGAIVVYHGDRLIRQPWDLELLINLADKRGLRLASVMGDRNLDNPDDRYILRIEAASACREVDSTSRRMKNHHEQRAARGLHRPGGRGGRAFGFEPDGLTHRAPEVAVIRECARRALAGESVGALCRDLAIRDIRTTAGNLWTHGSLKKTLCRPRMAGLLAHNGVVLGAAAWEPILDRPTWEAVRYLLETKGATIAAYTTNARRYLLTGIALCGSCQSTLVIRHNARSESLRGYGCVNPTCRKKVHRSQLHLDHYVIGAAVERLADPKLRRRITGTANAQLVTQLAALQGRRVQMLEEFGEDDELGADVLRISVARIDQRIAQIRQQIGEATTGHALEGLLGITEQEWEDSLTLDRQRAAVRALMRITVSPSTKRGPGFDKSTVDIDRLL